MLIRIVFFLIAISLIQCICAQEYSYDYVLFTNSRMEGDYFFSRTFASNGSEIKNNRQRLPVENKIFFTPGNSLMLQYKNAPGGFWSASIFKIKTRGQDHFRPATHLCFHIFITGTGGAWPPFIQIMYRDSSLTKKIIFGAPSGKWTWMKFPLEFFKKNLRVNEIIGVVFSQNGDQGEQTIFIDDIECSSPSNQVNELKVPEPIKATGYLKHVDLEWKDITPETARFIKIYRAGEDGTFQQVGIQLPFISRYSDYTGETGKTYTYKIALVDRNYNESALSVPVSAATKAMTDDELLDMVQRASFQYYWDGAEKTSGLAKENIPGRHNMIATGASGFGLMAIIVATERNFITREQSVERLKQVVTFLEKAETFHGAFSHFIDGPTGKVEPFFGKKDNGGDLVETSFLIQGLLAVRAYFNGNNKDEKFIRDKITTIWERVEWDWYKQFPDSKFLYWHWSPDQKWVINHPLIGWNETMVTYLLAIASPTHPVPASMYYTGWASQEPRAQKYRTGWGGTTDGSLYKNGNMYEGVLLNVGVSNGGPLFFTHYSFLGYNPQLITDMYTTYSGNNKEIAMINYNYCVRNPNHFEGYGENCWGLSASDGPYRYSADEPVKERDHGKIAPTGAIASFPYLDKPAMKALKNYYNNYGKFLWGEYGFRDAFNLTENWCSEIYMGLNQAPQVVMIENFRTGLVWNYFMKNLEVLVGLDKIAIETRERMK